MNNNICTTDKHIKKVHGYCVRCQIYICNLCRDSHTIKFRGQLGHEVIDEDEIDQYLEIDKQKHIESFNQTSKDYQEIKDKFKQQFEALYTELQIKSVEINRELETYFNDKKDIYDINMISFNEMDKKLKNNSKPVYKGSSFDDYKLNLTPIIFSQSNLNSFIELINQISIQNNDNISCTNITIPTNNNNEYDYLAMKQCLKLPSSLEIAIDRNILEVTGNSMVVSNISHNSIGMIRSDYEIPMFCHIFYFEVIVLRNVTVGGIAIGLSTAQTSTSRQVGWDKDTLGYHSDDGKLYDGNDNGSMYGPVFSRNDIIGCCINLIQGTVFFTINGLKLKDVLMNGYNRRNYGEQRLFPTISQRQGGSVKINFGSDPFMFDLKTYLKEKQIKSMLVSSVNVFQYPNYLTMLNENKDILPSSLSQIDKAESLGLSNCDFQASYLLIDNSIGLIRSNRVIPTDSMIYYFEVKILKDSNTRGISIGIAPSSLSTTCHTGWKNQSVGYHSDDGKIYLNSGEGQIYGPTFTTNDIVGCCVGLFANIIFIFYTKNGVQLGNNHLVDSSEPLFPSFGLSGTAKIEVNYGSQPFRFDIESLYSHFKL